MEILQKSLSLFFIYSFAGWLIEVIYVSIDNKKICDRGFLIGPICPIYGVSGVAMTLLLGNFQHDYVFVFLASTILCTLVEYFTSLIMEKLFKTRWWDYSTEKFNINGRVCLKNAFAFGILGTLVVTVLSPYLWRVIQIETLNIILIICVVVFIIDFIISFTIMHKIKVATEDIKKDNTEEINKKVQEFVQSQSFLYKRLFTAFPDYKIIQKIKNKVKETNEKVFYIALKEKLKKDSKLDEKYILDNLNDNYLKIKDSLSRCGNSVYEINNKKEIEKIINSFLNYRKIII